jgi:hypothetical protein
MKKLQESYFFSQIFIDQIKRLPRASVQHNWFSPCCSVPQYAEIISGREDFQSSPFGCTSVQALKGTCFICLAFPPLKQRAIFMRPSSAGLAPISGNQFQSAFISVELLAATCCAVSSVPPWWILVVALLTCVLRGWLFVFVIECNLGFFIQHQRSYKTE